MEPGSMSFVFLIFAISAVVGVAFVYGLVAMFTRN